MARLATLAVGAAAWIVLALFLWRTKVPGDLKLPHLDERALFGGDLVRDAQHYQRFLDLDWMLATVAGFGALGLMVWRGPRLARSLGLGPVNAGIVLGALALTVVWAVSLPFGIAAAWWARRHGISTESYGLTLAGAWGSLLSTIIGGFVLLALLLGLAKRLGRRWWIAATPVLVVLFAGLQLVIPYVLTLGTDSLSDPALSADIRRLEQREGAGNPPIREQKVSDTTTAANAFSVGIGPTERVVIWDTLLDGRFSGSEVRFVAAHELAHLARNHIAKGLGWFVLLLVPTLFVAALVTGLRGGLRDPGATPLLLLAVTAAQIVLLPLRNEIGRRYEAEADWIALQATRDPAAARGLFRGFADTSMQDPSPPAWAHVFLDDHPTLLARIEQAQAWRKRNR